MKKGKIVAIVISIFLVVVFLTLSLLYAFLPVFKNAFDNAFRKDNMSTTSASTFETREVLKELENKVVKIENDLVIFEDELKNTNEDNSVKIEELSKKIDDIKTELVVIKYQINLIKNNLSNYSNPNLFINGDFKINQRGLKAYSNYGYTIDRWLLMGNEQASLVVNEDNTITLTNNSNQDCYFVQYVEHSEIMFNRKVTLSMKYSSNNFTGSFTGYNGNQNIFGKVISFENTFVSETATIPSDGDYLKIGVLVPSNQSITIEFMKLEFGEIFTEYNPRLYAEEFNLCQRYYFSLGKANEYIAVGIGQFNTGNTIFCSGLYSIQMRIAPTTKLTGILKIRSGNLYLDSTNVSNFGSEKTFQLSITTSGTQTAGYACDLFLDKGAYLTFDAEIY